MTTIGAIDWDPAAYGRFADHRLRPVRDLVDRIPLAAPATVYDLGCGDGRATRLLTERWPEAAIVGLDSSPSMLAAAADRSVAWRHGDIAEWRPASPADLVFSNAALHWLDDHESLFPRLMAGLAPGGVLAVQVPRNHGAPSHQAIAGTAREGPWAARLTPLLRTRPVAEPERYYDILASHAQAIDLWETVYLHVLEGEDAVLRWIEGTALRPLLGALDEGERTAFRAACAIRLAAAYPRRADGRTLFPFRRLFLVAVR